MKKLLFVIGLISQSTLSFAGERTLDCTFAFRDLKSMEPMQGVNSKEGNNIFKFEDTVNDQKIKILESQNLLVEAHVYHYPANPSKSPVYLTLIDKTKADSSGKMGKSLMHVNSDIGSTLSLMFSVEDIAFLWGGCEYR
ncbi:MAG: hypothetical protein KA715_00880 [Xanthomonadaceae bacterium]|nr:hypothetical protein [Xanthomonadaceae bacterium]